MYWHSISQVPRGSVTFKKWLPPIFTPYLWSKIKSQVYLGITKTWLINLCTCGWSVFDTFDMFEIHLGEWHMFFFVVLKGAQNQHHPQLHRGLSLQVVDKSTFWSFFFCLLCLFLSATLSPNLLCAFRGSFETPFSAPWHGLGLHNIIWYVKTHTMWAFLRILPWIFVHGNGLENSACFEGSMFEHNAIASQHM